MENAQVRMLVLAELLKKPISSEGKRQQKEPLPITLFLPQAPRWCGFERNSRCESGSRNSGEHLPSMAIAVVERGAGARRAPPPPCSQAVPIGPSVLRDSSLHAGV